MTKTKKTKNTKKTSTKRHYTSSKINFISPESSTFSVNDLIKLLSVGIYPSIDDEGEKEFLDLCQIFTKERLNIEMKAILERCIVMTQSRRTKRPTYSIRRFNIKKTIVDAFMNAVIENKNYKIMAE